MLSQNIKAYRKAKGISQEELAVRLHVVRQTVSKWEHDRSVPDAQMLIQLAQVLEVPVSALLGTGGGETDPQQLSQELERVNGELARMQQQEALRAQANRKRGLILLLVFLTFMISLGVDHPVVSLALSGICMLTTLVILYRNMALLTQVDNPGANLKPLRITSIFLIGVFLVVLGYSLAQKSGFSRFTQDQESLFAVAIVVMIMVFAGIICPRLPFNRHTGLRLPWTVSDEDTWNLAHRILGYTSLPTAVLYLACSLTTKQLGTVSTFFILSWIGIPALISLAFYWKKFHQ